MKHLLLTFTSILLITVACSAQTPGIPSHNSIDDCILSTEEQAWTALGISSEQLEQVRSIQTMCETDCRALKETGGTDPAMAQAMLEKHRESLRETLSKEQYASWLEWCAGRTVKG